MPPRCRFEAEEATPAETSPAHDTWATTVAARRDDRSSPSSHPDWNAQAADRRRCDRSIGAPLALKPIAARPDGRAGSGTAASEQVALARRT